jgi:hypothetical protein
VTVPQLSFTASGQSLPRARISEDLRTLTTTGIVVDTIHDNNLQRCDPVVHIRAAQDGSSCTWGIPATAKRMLAYQTIHSGGKHTSPSNANSHGTRYQTKELDALKECIRILLTILALDLLIAVDGPYIADDGR